MLTQRRRGTARVTGPSSSVRASVDRSAGWFRRHPQAMDAALAAVLALFAVADLVSPVLAAHAALSPYADLAAALPLAMRRRRPATVYAVVLCVAVVQVCTQVPSRGTPAVLVALYTVGAHVQRRWVLAAAATAATLVGGAAIEVWAPAGEELGAFVLLTGTVIGAIVLGAYVRTRRAYLLSLLERAATAERERAHAADLAASTERSRIAREMHDVVAHSLSVMIALTDGARFSLRQAPDDAEDALRQASGAGRQAMAEMRRLVGVLREDRGPELAPQPDLASMDSLLSQVRATGLPVHLVVTGSQPDIPASAQLALYRIVQESLTNVRKHGRHVTAAKVRIGYDAGTVDVEVTDDGEAHAMDTGPATGHDPGTGTDPATGQDPATGHGLTGMRERAAVFGGTVTSAALPGRGWRVRAHLELPRPPAAEGATAQ